jgi:flagellar hook-length control protein FliK
MNLSSYLQMPPAPLVPNSSSTAAPQGARTGAGPSAGGNLGFDFAQAMAHQMARLVPQERQTFAADVPEQPEPVAQTPDARPTQARRADDRDDPDTESDQSDEVNASRTAKRQKGSTHKEQRVEVDTLLAGLMQGAPVAAAAVPVPAPNVANTPTPISATPAVLAAETAKLALTGAQATGISTDSTAALQTVELSPQMRIITDPQKAPSPESLAAFAKSMGLDESAIQNLLAQQPATPATTLASAAATGLTSSQPTPPSTALQAAMGQALQDGNVNPDSAVATQLTAMAAAADTTVATPVAASGAGLAAAATTLTAPTLVGLTPTDMAAIQQLQITVLPAAALPAAVLPANTSNAPVPSTLDMLSLLGTGVDEQDVSALLSRFSEDGGNESNSDQPPSQGESNQFSSFAQALSRSNAAANATAASTGPTAPNLSEVYDQLSDKMATEMAARMHKQLSDGEWKMKFALRPSNLGGVEIQLEMKDGKLDAVFRADNPLTRDLLQNSSQRLKEALANFGINAGQVNVGQGGGNTQQNSSGSSNRNAQVRDNSSSQVSGTGSVSNATSTRNKANASLLDLYA